MVTPAVDIAEIEKVINTVNDLIEKGWRINGKPSAKAEAARVLNISSGTLASRLRVGIERHGLKLAEPPPLDSSAAETESIVDRMSEELRVLKIELDRARKEELTRETVRKHIFEMKNADAAPPKWLLKPTKRKGLLGVPTLFFSDWHWAEVVTADQIGGANAYDLEIAHARARKAMETALTLLFEEFNNPVYDGIVLAFGGDMLSGNIHDELTETNELPIMAAIMDLFGVLVEIIDTLAGRFGAVFVPCVTGNHGRTTRKPQAKNRGPSNFDWLIYQKLAYHYRDDKRVSFLIPDGPDCYYRVYGHRYCLTHGDQFRGGDGITGALMPIMRGRHKKASRDSAISGPWDTIIMGHWHQLMQLTAIVVNGSLKGYDEYAFSSNFPFEKPAQGLWINHPDHGITHQMPIYVDGGSIKPAGDWVSVPKVLA